MSRALRIYYAAGPGDVLGTYRHWREGRDDPSQVAVTYSGQFYDLVRELEAEALVVASNRTPARLWEGALIIKHRAVPFDQSASGVLYHLGQFWSAIRLIGSALWYRADVAVVVNGTCDWFPLRVLPALGVEVVPTVHCVLWRKGERLRGVRKLIATLDRKFFARSVAALMSASHEITTQISKVAGGRARPVHEFLPSYRREQFAGLGEPPPQRKPFRVLFAGRIEREKGVFDLLEIAKAFGAAGRTEVEFDLCGTGGVLEELKAAVAAAGLGGRFRCHGHRDKATMREMFARCHAVIVPTTTQFIEGFNQVVAEGVLSGRPVITSSVCPALEYVREAVVEAPPDDVGAYGAAILRLCDDLNYYRSKVAGCRAAQGQFYDPERSWGTALRNVLRSAGLIAHARPAAWAATAVTAAKPSSSPSL